MEHKYKLIYFNLRGRAEVCRLLFALADVPYEDVRYEIDEWKNGLKDKLNAPFGQLPVLEIDNGAAVYCQSLSIARYLAEKFGYAGTTDDEKCRADMIAHCFLDLALALWPVITEEDQDRKEKLGKKFKEEQLPDYLKYAEAMLKSNKGGDGYFVGNSLTWADLEYVHQTDYISLIGMDPIAVLADYPKLKALKDRVLQTPKIAAWVARRPETRF